MNKNSRIYIPGHTGLLGSSLTNILQQSGYKNLILKTRQELDLRVAKKVEETFEVEKPEYVFLAAGKSGGIISNSRYPAEYLYENLVIATNIIHSAWKANVRKLLYIGCSCLYPRICPQPMKEEYLLSGPFEPTSEAYSVAKLAGLKMCQAYNKQYKTNFISCIAENLFGPNDKFDNEYAHVIPALISKFHKAKVNKIKEVVIWGTGKPKRGFLYVDDLAVACLFLMDSYDDSEVINISSGHNISIRDLALMIKEVVGFSGEIRFDSAMPDGMPEKFLDNSRIKSLGWSPSVSIREGLEKTYRWFLQTQYANNNS